MGCFAQPLTIESVLKSSAQHYPTIQVAVEKLREQQSKFMVSEGAFDAKLDVAYMDRPEGYYTGDHSSIMLLQPLQPLNATFFAQYRRSDGSFPIYEDALITDDDEMSLGLTISLLRNRDIDSRRFKLFEQAGYVNVATLDVLKTFFSIQIKSYKVYLDWVSAGLEYYVYKRLLDIAQQRQVALEEKAKQGDIAEIATIENKQLILQRQGSLVEAKRKFDNVSISLSLFYRTSLGRPQVITLEQLPTAFPDISDIDLGAFHDKINELSDINPEMQQLVAQGEILDRQHQLAQNDVMPELDLTWKSADDLGDSDLALSMGESVVSLKFSLPIQQRRQRGALDEVRAKQRQLELQKQFALETLQAEFKRVLTNLKRARELMAVTEEQVSLAKKMETFERVLFENGQSDFFRTNFREITTAKAEIQHIHAQKKMLSVSAELHAMMLNRDIFFFQD